MDFNEMADRRRGPRQDHWAEARWYYAIDAAADGSARGQSETVFIMNLSTSGLALVARNTPHVALGSQVGLEFKGENGMVTVRRIDPMPDVEETSIYGLEFTDPTSAVAIAVVDEFFSRTTR